MKKIYLLAASALLMLAACSSEDVAPSGVANTNSNAPMAVGFDTYTASTTRSGEKDVMTTSTLQTTGFGVFAQQAETSYSSSAIMDFMYNQEVTYSAPSWTYTPLKYWPNETEADMHNATGHATSTDKDVVSFFAYAPYVDATPGSGAVTSAVITDKDNAATPADIDNVGITALTKNTDTGDPKVSYQIAYTPSKSVDLLWGVAPSGGLNYTAVNNEAISKAEGTPLLSLVKPSKDQKIKFLFKHALARIGMTVVAAVDQIAPGGTLDNNTKIYVNSVTITDAAATPTIPTKGDLNLNNTTANVAKWENTTIGGAIKLVVSGTRSPEANLNPELIGTGSSQGQPGVTTSEKNVIKNNKYFMLIPTPGTDATLDVTINYTVITNDANVQNTYSTTNNVITKRITLSSKTGSTTGFLNNKAYNLKLILGLTSIKLDAEVADWEVEGDINVDLPKNQE